MPALRGTGFFFCEATTGVRQYTHLPGTSAFGRNISRAIPDGSTVREQLDPQAIVLTLNRALGIQPPGAADITLGDRVRMTVQIYPSGSTYELALNVLQGDADRAANTRVTTSDVNFVKARLNRSSSEAEPAGAAYTVFADLNGDGRIHTADVNAVKARLNDILPAWVPVAPALFSKSRIAATILA